MQTNASSNDSQQTRVSPGAAPGEPPSPSGRIAQDRYPLPIRVLHWLVVALVLVQVISSDWMEAWFDRARVADAAAPLSSGALVHAVTGAAILLLMAIRFLVRFSWGTPPAPGDLPVGLRILSRLNHFAFYLLLVALPLTGLMAVFFAPAVAWTHSVLTIALYAVLALHVAAVLWHMLVLRDGLLWRMLGR
jgi:cytochrome b561